MTKKILIASASSLLVSIFSKAAKDRGFDVLVVKDGSEAIQCVLTERPNCVIVDRKLPVIDGYGISRLIKNNIEMKHIVVIICSAENNSVHSFWRLRVKCDGFYVPSVDNIDNIFTNIDKLLIAQETGEDFEEIVSDKELELSGYMEYMYKSLNHELTNLYYTDTVFDSLDRIYKIGSVGESFVKNLRGVFGYDLAAVLINGIELYEFYDKNTKLSDKELNEFVHTARKDFENSVKERKDYKWNKNVRVLKFEKEIDSAKIKNYEVFTPAVNFEIPVTVHVATVKEQAMTPKIYENLKFFINAYAKIVNLAIQFNKAKSDSMLLRQSFSRMLPDKIINQIVDQSNTAVTNSSEKRKVAVMICDIRKFTTLSEGNKPEDLVYFLNSQYFTPLCRIIKENGGTTDKFMGDAIMSLFGAPESYMDNCDRVCTAAINMVKQLEQVDTSGIVLPADYKFNVGFGIHYGEMISGFVHSEDKIEYTVIGDNVNLASRVEGLTKQYGVHIIITEDVRKDLHNEYNLRYLDNVVVKGKSEPVKIYELRSKVEVYPQDFLAEYNKGMNQYIMGNWNTAIAYFEKALQILPGDGPSNFTIERCRNYLNGLNLDQWDSVKHAYIPSSK